MPQCVAHTARGTQCLRAGSHFENHCGTHFNKRLREDAEFRTRYETAGAEEAARRAAAAELRAAEQARRAAELRAAEAARLAAAAAARHAEKTARLNRRLEEIPTLGPMDIVDNARKVMELWDASNIAGMDVPKAYAALAYRPSNSPGFTDLMRGIIRLRFQAYNNHPVAARYEDVPAAERAEVLAAIQTALVPYGEFEPLRVIKEGDRVREMIARRVERERIAAEQARAREAEAARQAAFRQQLREAPVVFQRDPDGGINLRAFATDTQSVHRSSVQNSTHKAVVALLARPKLEGINALEEAVASFNDPVRVRWYSSGPTAAARAAGANAARDAAVTELTNDYFNTEAFSVRYGDVVDRVWAFIRGHEHHNDLCTRLAQEIYEGRGMCSNGKMARLVNVLQGYDDTLMTEAPREVFQFRMAALRKAPKETREAAARALFSEFNIPEAEQEAWLEPLMDDDDPAPAAAAPATA